LKVAVFGGTFNPLHIGHAMLADTIVRELGYDKVLFVPAFIPPHKQPKDSVSAEHRAKMVEIACSKDSRFELETCEIDRGGVSYTFDTICSLEKKYQSVLEGKIGLIMGRDLFSGFHLWHNAQLIAEKCTLILAERPYQKEDKKFSPSAKVNTQNSKAQNFLILKANLFLQMP
jgi:nicotinate-nucleotide adenylyltransferase